MRPYVPYVFIVFKVTGLSLACQFYFIQCSQCSHECYLLSQTPESAVLVVGKNVLFSLLLSSVVTSDVFILCKKDSGHVFFYVLVPI